MSELEPTVAELKEKLKQLDAEKELLASRLAAGDNSARANLNEAIQMSNRLEQILARLEPRAPEVEVMYGPPPSAWRVGEGRGLLDLLRTIFRRR